MTDKKLLHLLDQNPEEGMGLLMEQYMGLLWSACHLYLTNPEDIREHFIQSGYEIEHVKDEFEQRILGEKA